jgi:hypothetical protein
MTLGACVPVRPCKWVSVNFECLCVRLFVPLSLFLNLSASLCLYVSDYLHAFLCLCVCFCLCMCMCVSLSVTFTVSVTEFLWLYL